MFSSLQVSWNRDKSRSKKNNYHIKLPTHNHAPAQSHIILYEAPDMFLHQPFVLLFPKKYDSIRSLYHILRGTRSIFLKTLGLSASNYIALFS